MIYSKIFILCSVESMTMEALSTSSYISNLPQINPIFKTSLPSSQSSCWSCNPLIPNLRISDGSSHGGIRIQALSHNDDTSSEGDAESSGLGLFPGDIFSLSQISLALPQGAGNSGGNRAGLFRTPISGGVQNATSAHALPPPALAVCNLLEQARFAHLCTVMSKMHHRREGYPLGSLVDFAPDRMGHPIFLFSPLAIHTRNLLAEPRCSLVVQIPGWSGLSNARVTLFGDVYPFLRGGYVIRESPILESAMDQATGDFGYKLSHKTTHQVKKVTLKYWAWPSSWGYLLFITDSIEKPTKE
ncbi:hypothetical protein Bca101_062202 [Brassica carinata]